MLDARSVVLLAALAPFAPQDDSSGATRPAVDHYPTVKMEQVVRFVTVKTDEPDLADLGTALKELGGAVVYGPRTTSGRPGRSFFAVRLPWEVSRRDFERAARKAGGTADELAVTAYEGREGRDQKIDVGPFGFTSRDFVVGISGDIDWFDSVGGWSQFYGRPGKIDAEDLSERYIKLYAPYGGGSLGRVVEEDFTWTLKSVPDEKRGARLLKAVEKLDGVLAVELVEADLTVRVRLADLAVAQPAGTFAAGTGEEDAFDAAGLGAPRAAWCTRPLWDLLEELDLEP